MVNEDLQNEKLYTISQQEVLRIERILKRGVDSDIDSEDESSDASENEQLRGPSRGFLSHLNRTSSNWY